MTTENLDETYHWRIDDVDVKHKEFIEALERDGVKDFAVTIGWCCCGMGEVEFYVNDHKYEVEAVE